MRWVVVFVTIVVAALLEDWIRLEAQNHPVRVGVVGGVALLIAGLALFVASSRFATVAAAFVFGAWAIGLIAGLDDRDHKLGYYCRYGADSQAQLDDCMARVNTDAIDKLDTPAARFARGETSVCGPGSGRYCAEAARDNTSGRRGALTMRA
jgi:hypothetical protein